MHDQDVEVTVSASNMLSSVQVKKTEKHMRQSKQIVTKGSATTEKLYVAISKSTSHVVASVQTINKTVTKNNNIKLVHSKFSDT